ncbi:MAG: MerR family transcriptional regulator [Myxococcota bacterium]
MAEGRYKVKEVAALSGVTVRTLHHYDTIGLLCPTARTSAGYRLYDDAALLRLHQILVYRELGLALEQIRAVLEDPDYDPVVALAEQRERLVARAEHTQSMIHAVDAALRTLRGERVMNMKEIFDGFDPSEHEAEAKRRWGDTEAYKESARRTKGYSEDDWRRIKAETDDLLRRLAAALAAGVASDSPEAVALAEEHRLQIDRFFYPCSHAMHRNLALMYTADARFEANLDKHGAGVAAFLSAAIQANADASEA